MVLRISILILCIYFTVTLATNPCCHDPAYPVMTCVNIEHVAGAWVCTCENSGTTEEKLPSKISSVVSLALRNVTIANLGNCLRTIGNHSADYDVIEYKGIRAMEISGRGELSASESLQYSDQLPAFPSLLFLKLKNIGISSMYLNFFQKFPSISDFAISENNLETLRFKSDGNYSETLPSLYNFNVSNNNISDIEVGTFDHMTSLAWLDLSHNNLETIPEEIFGKLTMLSQLFLQENRLVTVSSHMFNGLFRLTSLNLRNNLIQNVEFSEKLYFNMTSSNNDYGVGQYALQELTFLDLSYNEISVFENDSNLAILSQLEILNLSRNHLEVAKLSHFLLLCELYTLDLTNNLISRVEDHVTVASETCLTRAIEYGELEGHLELDLSSNQLTEIGNFSFSNMPWLRVIKLNSNKLVGISDAAFSGLPYLKELYLSENLLNEFDAQSLSQLRVLDLSENLFTQVSRSWVDSMAPDREGQLLLGGNRLMCDSKMAYLFSRASCNEISERDLYSTTSLNQLNGLTQVFNKSTTLTLPSPGVCVVLVASEKCAMRLGSDFNKCLLRSYLELAKASPDPAEVFKPLLNNLEILFHYARVASEKFSSRALARGKENIIYTLNNIAGKLDIDNGLLIGYIGADVILGISGVTSQKRRRSIIDGVPGLGFSLTKHGNGAFLKPKSERMSPFVQQACNTSRDEPVAIDIESQIEIVLPPSLYQQDNTKKITFAVYKDDFMFSSALDLKTPIISADIFNKSVSNLVEPVVITATIDIHNNATNASILCGFWDFNKGNWSDDGCKLANFKAHNTEPATATVTCHCQHLTNFGILLDYNPTVNKDEYDYVINYISYVGLTASITGLIITIIYRLSNKEHRRGVPQIILLHLCFNLLILYLSLIVSDVPFISIDKGLCFSTGIITHLSLISVWGWAVTEAVSMYLLLVRVYNVNLRNFLTKSTVMCYGVAILIVGASLFYSAMRSKFPARSVLLDYSKGGLCFPTSPNNWYFVITPIAAACLLNCTLFVFIVVALNRTAKSEASGDKKRVIKNRLRQAICITALLGVTWVIGFLKIAIQGLWGETGQHGAFAIDIIFATCNSMQGFVIFLMFCAAKMWEKSRCMKTLQRLHTDSFRGKKWTSSGDGTESTNTNTNCQTKV